MLRLFDFGVICYEIQNGRHILLWLASRSATLLGSVCVVRELLYEISCLAKSSRVYEREHTLESNMGRLVRCLKNLGWAFCRASGGAISNDI